MKEILQSIYDSYTDRIKSPFVGSYIISFLAFNWRPIAIIFGSEWPMHCRIEWINQSYFKIGDFLWPVIIALFYILALPYINLGFDWCLKKYNEEKFTKHKAKSKAALEKEKEEASLIREIADAKAGTSQIDTLTKRIEALENENTALTLQNQGDLDRHNKILQQSKTRENEYLGQIRLYRVQISLINSNSNFINKDTLSTDNISKLLQVDDTITNNEKANFHNLVKTYRESNNFTAFENMSKFEKLGLISVLRTTKTETYSITPIGNLYFEYIKLGLDLI